METNFTKEIKRNSLNKVVTIFDRIPATIASIFSVMFALSIVLELINLVQGFVLIFLIIFIILFLSLNEVVKVIMVKRVFNGVKTAIIPFIISFSISVSLSGIGIWFWVNKTVEIKQVSNIEKVRDINEIKKEYNYKILNLKNQVFEETEEYKSLNLELGFLKSRGSASIDERNKIRDNIYKLQDKLLEQREKYNNNKQNQIESLIDLMNDEISVIDVQYQNNMEKSDRNNFISYIFLSLILITEFAIIILNKILSEKENKFKEILNSDIAQKYLVQRNILESIYLTKNINDTININNVKYSPLTKDNVLEWNEITKMYNLFISLGIFDKGQLNDNVLTNNIMLDKSNALILFDKYYNSILKLRLL